MDALRQWLEQASALVWGGPTVVLLLGTGAYLSFVLRGVQLRRLGSALRVGLLTREEKAIEIAVRYGGIDGEHHKAWVIDQMVRALAGDRYAEIVRDAKAGDDGPDTYDWDEGVAP